MSAVARGSSAAALPQNSPMSSGPSKSVVGAGDGQGGGETGCRGERNQCEEEAGGGGTSSNGARQTAPPTSQTSLPPEAVVYV